MAAVPDSSPLILLGKIEKADLLTKLYGSVLVTPRVWDEVITVGKKGGARDAGYLESSAQRLRLLRIWPSPEETELAVRLAAQGGMGLAEAEVLAVAGTRGAIAVVDDKAARTVALASGIPHVGTLSVLYHAFLRRFVTFDELVAFLERLGSIAWISPDLLAGIIRRAREEGPREGERNGQG